MVTNKLIRLLLIFVSLIVILINGAAIYAGMSLVANKTLFVVHIARLYAKAPDQNLAMPVQGVMKSQIADTWHVPREGDRLHEGQDIFAKRGTPVLSATDGYIVRIGENNLGGQTVSVIGAGGTARAALVALRRAGVEAALYNRTPKEGTRPLDALSRFDGDLIINALPAGVEVQIPPVATIIEAAYSGARTPDSGRRLLEAQAIRQNELFVQACST